MECPYFIKYHDYLKRQARCLFLAFLILAGIKTNAQRVEFKWARSSGSTRGDFGIAIAVDDQGNLFSTGYFFGTVDFDPGASASLLTAGKFGSAFLTKWDRDGNFIWAKMLAQTDRESVGMSLAIDIKGNIYTTGSFGGTTDFDPGLGTFNMTALDSTDIFVSKLDNDGNLIWAKQFMGNTPNNVRQLKLDHAGNVYITGVFEGTIDFDPGPNTFNITNIDGASFLVKLDPDGNFVWAKSYFTIFSFDIDENDKIITGGSGAGIVIQKLDTDGNLIWTESFGGSGTNFVSSIAADKYGNIYISGRYTGEADLDPGPQIALFTDPGKDGEVFLSKLDPGGKFQWAKKLGINWRSPGFDPASMDVDKNGNPYLTADFTGIVDFDPGDCEYKLDAAQGYMYLLKLDNSGNIDWAHQIGGTQGEARPSSILLDREDNIYTTGWYNRTVDMDPGPLQTNFTYRDTTRSFGGDIFVHKMGPRQACKTSTLQMSACGSLTMGCNTYITSGTYIQRIELPGGCDSIVIINLQIGRVITDTVVSVCGNYLWGDSLITSPGKYTRIFRTPSGCDSIVNLSLSMRKSPDTSFSKTICKGNIFEGYSKTGIYRDTFAAFNGCDSIRTLNLKVISSPQPDLGPDIKICTGDSITLDAGPDNTYQWQNGSRSRYLKTDKPGTYEVRVSNACGTGSDQVRLSEGICDIYFPNAFTPDNNGLNDRFHVLGDLKLQYYHLVVFDRWGKKIFETRDPAQGWNGRTFGKDMPQGSYPWQCTYRTIKDGAEKKRHGTVSLIR